MVALYHSLFLVSLEVIEDDRTVEFGVLAELCSFFVCEIKKNSSSDVKRSSGYRNER